MKKNILQKENAITLIALVITIVVIVILAGIMMRAMLTGGLLHKASEASFKNKMSAIAEEVSMYKVSMAMNENGQDNSSNLCAGDVLKKIIKEDDLEIDENSVLDIKSISNSVSNTENKYVMILNGILYYVSQPDIQNNDLQVRWCNDIGIAVYEFAPATGIKKVSGSYELINGIYVCTPDLSTGFDKSRTRYLYEKNGNLVVGDWATKKPNDGWYDYANSKWANIFVENNGVESYFVWIPRYCYKVDSENSVSGNERMDVKFINTKNQYIDGTTGTPTEWETLETQGYKIPEAFWWDNDNDGVEALDERLPGYWISKYQLTDTDSYILDYTVRATTTSMEVRDIKVENTTKTPAKYTYALNGEIKHTSTNGENYKFENIAPGTRVINVTVLDANGEIISSMTKIYETAEVNPPTLKDPSGNFAFNPNTTFYVYWDDAGNEHNEIPISKQAPTGWYDYTISSWANIVTRNDGIETYLVWIPRYQYMLDSTSNPQKSYIKFIKETSTDVSDGYKIPEAFWWDNDNDGEHDEGEELTGYWISKYQLSIEEANPKVTTEMSAGSNLIRIQEIKGTAIDEAKENSTSLKIEYYINGEKKHDSTNPSESYVFTNLQQNTTYGVNVIVRNASTNEYIGAVTKEVKTVEPYAPELSYDNKGFDKDKTYYVVYNDNGTETLTSINQNPPSNWYDYSNKKWANIVVTDGTVTNGTLTGGTYKNYFVWIPRYEYKILEDRDNLDKSNRRIEVTFITTDITNDNCSPGYKVPEAFWWDNDSDGEVDSGEQLKGYWISKYQLSDQ